MSTSVLYRRSCQEHSTPGAYDLINRKSRSSLLRSNTKETLVWGKSFPDVVGRFGLIMRGTAGPANVWKVWGFRGILRCIMYRGIFRFMVLMLLKVISPTAEIRLMNVVTIAPLNAIAITASAHFTPRCADVKGLRVRAAHSPSALFWPKGQHDLPETLCMALSGQSCLHSPRLDIQPLPKFEVDE